MADPVSPFAAFFGQNVAHVPAHPSNPRATFQLATRGSECLISPLIAQSFHRDYIMVALGDATTRILKADLSPDIWDRAVHPADEFFWEEK